MTEVLSQYTAFIEKGIKGIQLPSNPSNLYEPINYILSLGGKRIRPILTLMGAELFGSDKKDALSQALAIEVFHNFSLLHDDIMDEAPLRRSHPTVHNKWNQNIAILSGDALLVKAYQLLNQNTSPEQLKEALELFNKTAMQVCEGQQMDMDFENRMDVTIHEYIEMIRLKTSVLLGCALQLGAIMSGAEDSDKKNLYEFGMHVGIAFQIQDDILDLYGNADLVGKQVGGDIVANKKTILHLSALNKATKEQIEILKQLQKGSDLVLKINRTKELFDHLKAKEDCQDLMQNHFLKARKALGKIKLPEERKRPLLQLADSLMRREL